MVVFLHSLSTERVIVEKVVEKRAIIETDEREEIACVGRPGSRPAGHETSQR